MQVAVGKTYQSYSFSIVLDSYMFWNVRPTKSRLPTRDHEAVSSKSSKNSVTGLFLDLQR